MIHVKSVVVNDPLDHTREATVHDARNEPASADTAIQCARRPVRRPKKTLRRAPASGKAGTSQTVDTASIYRPPPGVSSNAPSAGGPSAMILVVPRRSRTKTWVFLVLLLLVAVVGALSYLGWRQTVP